MTKGLVSRRWTRILATIAAALPAAGCQLAVDPFTDELASQRMVTTASVDGARAAQATPTILRRHYEPAIVRAAEGTVTHGPLYFEDGFENLCSDDGRFAWTSEDYLYLSYWHGRSILNGLLLPVSAAIAPPWIVMESDGELGARTFGFKYDARRRTSPDCG
jgi:hypothetical protein